MIVKPVKIKEIPPKQKGYISKRNLVSDTVERFMRSSRKSVELIDDDGLWSNSNNFRRSFQSYLNTNCITEVVVTIRGNRVFLIKG